MNKNLNVLSNKLVLLIDGAWLMRKSIFPFEARLCIDNPIKDRQLAAHELNNLMLNSITKILKQIPEIDNIIVTTEGGSWRKKVAIPSHLNITSYKGNRIKSSDVDWVLIFDYFDRFTKQLGMYYNTTCVKGDGLEGDDWMWYWSNYLSHNNVSCLIWSSDCDLQQLVKENVYWYNDNAGLVYTTSSILNKNPTQDLATQMFDINIKSQNSPEDVLIDKFNNKTLINAEEIVIKKVLCGDKGDNVPPICSFTKQGKNYGFTNKNYVELQSKFSIQTVQELKKYKIDICAYIAKLPKFIKYKIPQANIETSFEYNLKMVYLDKSTIPTELYPTLNKALLRQAEVNKLRYRIMTIKPQQTNQSYITELFNS